MVNEIFVTVGWITRSRVYGCSSEPAGEVGGRTYPRLYLGNGARYEVS